MATKPFLLLAAATTVAMLAGTAHPAVLPSGSRFPPADASPQSLAAPPEVSLSAMEPSALPAREGLIHQGSLQPGEVPGRIDHPVGGVRTPIGRLGRQVDGSMVNVAQVFGGSHRPVQLGGANPRAGNWPPLPGGRPRTTPYAPRTTGRRDYLPDQEAAYRRALMRRQLELQAMQAGLTSLWEVQLYPGPGVSGFPRSEIVLGRDSRIAEIRALARNPGYVTGPVRKIAGH